MAQNTACLSHEFSCFETKPDFNDRVVGICHTLKEGQGVHGDAQMLLLYATFPRYEC